MAVLSWKKEVKGKENKQKSIAGSFPLQRFFTTLEDRTFSDVHRLLLKSTPKKLEIYVSFNPRSLNLNCASAGGTIIHILLAHERGDFAQTLLEIVFQKEKEKKTMFLDFSQKDREDKTILILAAKVRQFQFLEFLFREQAKNEKVSHRMKRVIDFEDLENKTTADYAVLYGEIPLVTDLWAMGAQIKKSSPPSTDELISLQESLRETLVSVEIDPDRSLSTKSNAIQTYLKGVYYSFPPQSLDKLKNQLEHEFEKKRISETTFQLCVSSLLQIRSVVRPPSFRILATKENLQILKSFSCQFCPIQDEQHLETLSFSDISVVDWCLQQRQKMLSFLPCLSLSSF